VSKERLSELLTELNSELQSADDIDRLTGETHLPAIDRAKHLESRFAADHPVAERIARELADVLTKMGI
jgi:hypothetical protein